LNLKTYIKVHYHEFLNLTGKEKTLKALGEGKNLDRK
jgi:hypothetical protein